MRSVWTRGYFGVMLASPCHLDHCDLHIPIALTTRAGSPPPPPNALYHGTVTLTGRRTKRVAVLVSGFCLSANMPEDVKPLQELYMLTQACVLLLVLKQHLKEMYGFTDA